MPLAKNNSALNPRTLTVLIGGVGAAALAGGFVAVLSFVLAALAVIAAQEISFLTIGRLPLRRVFYFWSVKFSLTILFLSIALRGLNEGALLSGLPYMGGVLVGLFYNFSAAIRFGDKMTALTAQKI